MKKHIKAIRRFTGSSLIVLIKHPIRIGLVGLAVVLIGAGVVIATSISGGSNTVPAATSASSSASNPAPSSSSTPVAQSSATKSANAQPDVATNTTKPFIPGICTKTTTPYTTQYTNTYELAAGQTQVLEPGIDGSTESCTNNSDGTNDGSDYLPITMVPRLVEVGVAASTTTPPEGISEQQAESNCNALLANGGSDSSAYAQCLEGYGY
jgi:hypothetical protein